MNGDISFIQWMLLQGGFAGLFFLVWYFQFKHTKEQQKTAAKTQQENFKEVLSQAQSQFDESLKNSQKQHADSITQNENTLNKMFSLMEADIKYKALLTETLTKLDIKLDHYQKEKSGK